MKLDTILFKLGLLADRITSARLSDFALWRAFIGGHWEYQRRLGWYRHEPRVPPFAVERQEDNTEICIPVRGIVFLTVVIVGAFCV